MLRRRRVAGDAAPTFSAIVRQVHAALIGGPHLSRFRAGAKQRRDCAGWLWPTGADALPALGSEPAIQPAIRTASHVRGVRPGRRRYHDAVRFPRIERHAAKVADLETRTRRAPRRAGVVALKISVARRHAQRVGGIAVNGELVSVPRPLATRSRQVRPPSIVDTSAASLDGDPESSRFERVARDPANVMSVRSRRKRPFRRRGQCLQAAGLLPRSTTVRRAPHFAGFRAHPHDIALNGARGDGHNQPARKAKRQPGLSAIVGSEHAAPVSPTPGTSVSEHVRSEASRTVADALCRHEGTALNVNDDDLTVGGDQYRHRLRLTNDCRALGARSRVERRSLADDIGRLLVLT
jgi:hypothetical protein